MKRETKLKKWSLSKCKKEFDKVFSLYIRTRDKFTCFTCGRKGNRSNIDSGHYIPRGACNLQLYFHEDNCHACCTYCNHVLEGNRHVYREKLGEEMHKKLYKIQGEAPEKWSKEDYLDKIDEYIQKTTNLNNSQ